jgi:hypothetical protein
MNGFSCNRRVVVRSRREFLQKSSFGFGALALGYLLNREVYAMPPAPAKAKHVIFVFFQGGPSQVDTFDPKPALKRFDGSFFRKAT